MHARLLVDGWDTHQARNGMLRALAAKGDESAVSPGVIPAFWGSSPVLTWINRISLLLDAGFPQQWPLRSLPVDGVDDVEQLDGLTRLVGLERPDQVEFDTGVVVT